ncbi:MAG: flagellar basal body P-ring formation protein FlgA [Fibrobacter sp.]|jgi:flagella basal body P-ring formation protein FlgA|nr:flagellar basal body P-ring formation protein FlgA [Fibrobacter sp.]
MTAGKVFDLYMFIIICSALTGLSAASDLTLTFKDSVLITDTAFFLDDIAEIECNDNTLKAKLLNMAGGKSAPAGYGRFLNVSDFVLYKIKPLLGNTRLNVSGVQRVYIKTESVEKKIEDYLGIIQQYFREEILWPQGCYEAVVKEPGRSWKCFPGDVTAKVEGLANRYPRGNVQLWLVIEQKQRSLRIPVMCNVKVVVPVLVARRPILRGQQITSEDCELKSMDITTFGPHPLFNIDSLIGVRAVRTINPGTIVHTRLLEAIPAIQKGDLVEILVRKGNVKVAIQGVARESGKIGERIWVENTNSRKLVQVIIKNRGTVTVAQGGLSI